MQWMGPELPMTTLILVPAALCLTSRLLFLLADAGRRALFDGEDQ
jgi:hypothetical protein